MSIRRSQSRIALWGQSLTALVMLCCGTHAGTESGNPIGPPPPVDNTGVLDPVLPDLPSVGDPPAFSMDPQRPGGSVSMDPPRTEGVEPTEPPAEVVMPVTEPPLVEPDPPAPATGGDEQPAQGSPMAVAPTAAAAPEMVVEPPMAGAARMPVAVPAMSPGLRPAAAVVPPSMCEPVDCAAKAQAVANALGVPLSPVPSSDVQCEAQADGEMACICGTANAAGVVVVERAASAPATCLVSGRLGHECLLDNDEFAGCGTDDQSCADFCADVDESEAVRAAQTYEAVVVSSRCGEMGECSFVIRVGQICHEGEELVEVECPTAR